MSNEEMNKKMEFIIEWQAKFAADMEIMRETQAAAAKQFKEQDRRISDSLIGLLSIVGTLTKAQIQTDEKVELLTDAQTRTDQSVKELAEAQKRADERLNIFINVVERYISGNGGTERHA